MRQLETAARHFESGIKTSADLAILAQPGSSLGGARPKATIEDAGELRIAKVLLIWLHGVDTEFGI